tara:strand:- start:666 stop:1802 length:1137 start_codon:yes stop_codon:yes gene_type:complete
MALPQKEIYEVFPDAHSLGSAEDFNRRLAAELSAKRINRQKELGTAEDRGARAAGTQMGEAASRLASLPEGFGAYGYGSGRSGIKTDPYLAKKGPDYSGWHRSSPVNMDTNLDDDAWVKGAYKSLLGRDVDQGGLDYWKADLRSGQTRDQVVGKIKGNQEYKDKFLGHAYDNLLGKPLGAEGKDYWSKQYDAGMSEDDIISNIKLSPEYGRIQQDKMRQATAGKTSLDLLHESAKQNFDDKSRIYRDAQEKADQSHIDRGIPYQTPAWSQESPRANQLAAQAALASYDPNSAPKSGSWLLNTIKEAANPALKDAVPKIGGLIGDWWNKKGSGSGQNTDTSKTDKYFDKLVDPGSYTPKVDKVKDGIKSLNWYNFGGLL